MLMLLYPLQAYPAMFDWVMYPIQVMLEAAWRACEAERKSPSPYLVETIALLEQALAYAYIGSAKVLSHAVMEPLFTSQSLIDQGFPTINQAVIRMQVDRKTYQPILTVCQQGWPSVVGRKAPAICSTGAQQMYYSKSLFDVSCQDVEFLLITVLSMRQCSQACCFIMSRMLC